jgi:hypothetical protein
MAYFLFKAVYNCFLVKGFVFVGFQSFSKINCFLVTFPVFQGFILSFFSDINGLYWFVCGLIAVLMILLLKGLFLSVSKVCGFRGLSKKIEHTLKRVLAFPKISNAYYVLMPTSSPNRQSSITGSTILKIEAI